MSIRALTDLVLNKKVDKIKNNPRLAKFYGIKPEEVNRLSDNEIKKRIATKMKKRIAIGAGVVASVGAGIGAYALHKHGMLHLPKSANNSLSSDSTLDKLHSGSYENIYESTHLDLPNFKGPELSTLDHDDFITVTRALKNYDNISNEERKEAAKLIRKAIKLYGEQKNNPFTNGSSFTDGESFVGGESFVK